MVKSIWTRKDTQEFPNESFLFVRKLETGGKFKFLPHSDGTGIFSKENFLHSLAMLHRAGLSEDEKHFVMREAFRVAAKNGVVVSDYFLDESQIMHPIFGDYAFHTMVEFNAGAFSNYTKAEIDMYGERLAKVVSTRTTVSTQTHNFDPDGEIKSSEYDSTSDVVREYTYQNGVIIRNYDHDENSSTTRTEIEKPEQAETTSEPYFAIVQNVYEVVSETDESGSFPFMAERYEKRDWNGAKKRQTVMEGRFLSESIKKNENGTFSFDVPLFVLGELTYNNNRYTKKCAENLLRDMSNILEGRGSKNYEEKSSTAIMLQKHFDGVGADMRTGHDSRFGKGNELLEIAGRVTGGYVANIEGKRVFVLKGETLPTQAGKDVSYLMGLKPPLLRGVSLFSLPTEFEENTDGGHDVDRMHLCGADFTNSGANLRQFNKANSASFFNVQAA